MLFLITAYLIQSENSTLPHIGHFTLKHTSAVNDGINRKMLPPQQESVFKEDRILESPLLVNFIATRKNIIQSQAAADLDRFCKEWRQQIDAGERLCFENFGCLERDESGVIIFLPAGNIPYNKPVSANLVSEPGTEHSILVGEPETIAAMPDYYNQQPSVQKRNWLIWAAVFFIIGLILLAFSFSGYHWSTTGVGNRSHFFIKSAGETYLEAEDSSYRDDAGGIKQIR